MADDTDGSSYEPDNNSGEESPVIEASGATKKRRKVRKQRRGIQGSQKDSYASALGHLAAKRNASNSQTPNHGSTSTRKAGRKKSSIVWNHCYQREISGQV